MIELLEKEIERHFAALEELFLEFTEEYFEKNPEHVIVVEAFTPYFNDGEPCEWHISAIYMENDEDEKEIPEFAEVVYAFPEHFFKKKYEEGNMRMKVTRSGITTDYMESPY